MAVPSYGPGEHLKFEDFPERIQTVVGSLLEGESGRFTSGQPVFLYQTPLSRVVQGDYVLGEELPPKRIIFTDTGEDDNYNLKICWYGWGEFWLQDSADDYFSLRITKGMVVHTPDWDEEKLFEAYWTGPSKVKATDELLTEWGIPTASDEEVIDDILDEYAQEIVERLDTGDYAHMTPENAIEEAINDEVSYRMAFSPKALSERAQEAIRDYFKRNDAYETIEKVRIYSRSKYEDDADSIYDGVGLTEEQRRQNYIIVEDSEYQRARDLVDTTPDEAGNEELMNDGAVQGYYIKDGWSIVQQNGYE